MKNFYSPSKRGFYNENIHGTRMIPVPDPNFIPPMKFVVPAHWEEPEGYIGEPPAEEVPDLDAVPTSIEVVNPDCLIPDDALEITDDQHRELMDAQAAGFAIAPGPNGFPIACNQPAPDAIEIRRRRAFLIAATDWTQLGDIPSATKAEWTSYRQALRDIPEQAGFPSAVEWPVAPA